MKHYENNLIGKDTPDYLDLEVRSKSKLSKDWFPLECYDMVQCGYPYPDHGEMILRSDGGWDGEYLLPSNGMWVKKEDVIKLLKEIKDTCLSQKEQLDMENY